MSGVDAGTKIDKLLLQLPKKSKTINLVKKQGGLNALLPPIKNELKCAKEIALAVRKNALRKLLEQEMREHECELRKKGICLTPAYW